MENIGVVVVAAGRGSRMGTNVSKPYLPLAGKPVIVHTLERFEQMPEVGTVVVVAREAELERCRQLCAEYGLAKVCRIVPGGAERQDSVYLGLQALNTEWVLIHDAVRPFVQPEHIRACIDAAMQTGAAVLAVPVVDTIKQVDERGRIAATPDRRSLWAIQTPQAFRRLDLLEAHRAAAACGFVGTDDSMLAERLGIPVQVVEGAYSNRKLTTPDDLAWAEFWIQRQRA
jgi:2-C-methyl-D-erythritol 4-phosphate cytidylyltransferase